MATATATATAREGTGLVSVSPKRLDGAD